GFWSNEDNPLLSVMLALMRPGRVSPDFLGPVDIARSQNADFHRSTSSEPLESDHIGRHLWHEGERCFDFPIVYGAYRRSPACFTAPTSQTGQSLKILPQAVPHKLLGSRPPKHTANTGHMLVNSADCQIILY